MSQSDFLPRDLIDRYRRSGIVTRAGETIDDYVDLRAALLDQFDQSTILAWFRTQLAPDHLRDLIVGSGPFGAGLCALLASQGWQTAIYNPKGYGVEWSGRATPKRAVFVDDVLSTGATVAGVQAAAAARGISIVRTVVGWDRRLD